VVGFVGTWRVCARFLGKRDWMGPIRTKHPKSNPILSLVIFAEAGARAVYALDIHSPDNFASLAAEMKAANPNCHFEPVIADAASEADVKGICDKAIKDFGRLDVFFAKWGD
jgi:hypothetical protein